MLGDTRSALVGERLGPTLAVLFDDPERRDRLNRTARRIAEGAARDLGTLARDLLTMRAP